ncbi:hypothetical protein GGQ68_000403 [Sagittula marina]|uniref:Uncharacterized protein n=1 Tax=Sagittula marina TaxID=943940 RepID=A0A7W6GQY4_9RHOB|nr:hypothetical protein [Sagittula marina]MBB3984092.1 hypothetical protein [Sagittula marina]
MDRTSHRQLLSSLVLVPALAAVVIAVGYSAHLPTAVLATFGGVAAVFAALTYPKAKKRPLPLTKMMPLRGMPSDLPSETRQRSAVASALEAAQTLEPGPSTREQAVAWTLLRVIQAWQPMTLSEATETRLATLYMLERLLTSTPGEAGRLAQYFRRPDSVLSLRDEIDQMALVRAEWDRCNRLFLATQGLWTRQNNDQTTWRLIDGLQALGPADVDLWHHVVLHHDSTDPQQREAALWCLRHAACDQTTVATYLAHIVTDGTLVAAAQRGDSAYLCEIRTLIERWNAGYYRDGLLELDASDALSAASSRMEEALQKVASLTRSDWPRPHGAFLPRQGRPARMRPNWNLRQGRMVAPPKRKDYFDPATEPATQMGTPV